MSDHSGPEPLQTYQSHGLRYAQAYKMRQKSGPLKFFAVFSATVWNFNMKFYSFLPSTSNCEVKCDSVKNDKVIDFSTWSSDFSAIKILKLKKF